MSELKPGLKTPGAIRLMELDTSTLFLPFGRPVADYLRGQAVNGTRAALKQGAIDFVPLVRWTKTTSSQLRTTGFGELEQEALIPAAEPADPGVADFLAFEQPGVAARDASRVKTSPPIAPEPNPVSLPRLSALPLRPRLPFGPPPPKPPPPTARHPITRAAPRTHPPPPRTRGDPHANQRPPAVGDERQAATSRKTIPPPRQNRSRSPPERRSASFAEGKDRWPSLPSTPHCNR